MINTIRLADTVGTGPTAVFQIRHVLIQISDPRILYTEIRIRILLFFWWLSRCQQKINHLFIIYNRYLYLHQSSKKTSSERNHKTLALEIKGFSNHFCLLMEGSGPLQILRIRIRMAQHLRILRIRKQMGPRTTSLSVFLQIPYGVVHQIRNVF
jgi:hypothetical protein